jgi:ubiquitin-protein ligase
MFNMVQETDSVKTDICKDFHRLMKNVKSLSGGQAAVTEWKEDNLQWFKVEICPSGGLYHGGKFVFKVQFLQLGLLYL